MTPSNGLFISYARADEPAALRLYEALASTGHDVWLDMARLRPGIEWWDGVRHAIDHCVGVLFLASDESSRSTSCSRELAYAVSCGKRVVPIGVDSSAQYAGWTNAASCENSCEPRVVVGSRSDCPYVPESRDGVVVSLPALARLAAEERR